jgi:ubiquinone biosynthesis monooxygenase Coq6
VIGSRTALLLYTRERYIENHKMMSAVDKLHKLYSSTAEPVVWARSAGLEVLNELDSLKGAIMASAGASASGPGGGDPGLRMAELAAGGVQGVMGVLGAAKVMGGLVGRAVVGGLRGAREGILNGNKR